MSNDPAQQPPAEGGAQLIPPLPSRARKGGKPGKPGRDSRVLLWLGAFAVGIGLGVSAYQWVPMVDDAFDYGVALVLS